jgi:PAS domain S-box-containing protein
MNTFKIKIETTNLTAENASTLFEGKLNEELIEIGKLLAENCAVPLISINIIDQENSWTKVIYGDENFSKSYNSSFCLQTLAEPKRSTVVSDALQDSRFSKNDLVINSPKIRFYAGCVIYDTTDNPIGTISLFDSKPKVLSTSQEAFFKFIVGSISDKMNLNDALLYNKRIEQQMNFYAYILNNIPSDIAVFDLNNIYLYVNPKGIRDPKILEFMIGKTNYDYCKLKGISNDLAEVRQKGFDEILRSKKSVEWEDDTLNAQGERVVILRRMAPLFDVNGEICNVIGYGNDITLRKEAEEKLHITNQQLLLFEYFLKHTSDVITVSNEKGEIVYFNKAAIQLLGLNHSKINSYQIKDIDPLFQDKSFWEQTFERFKINKNERIETVFKNKKTGQKIDVELNVAYEEFDGNSFLISIARDIREKKKAEIVLHAKNTHIRDITNAMNSSSMVITADKRGTILSVNSKFCKTTKYLKKELIGKKLSLLNSGYHTKEFWDEMWHTINSGEIWKGEIKNKAKTGAIYWVDTMIYPIKNNRNEVGYFLSITHDITAKKENEFREQKKNKTLIRQQQTLFDLALLPIETDIESLLKIYIKNASETIKGKVLGVYLFNKKGAKSNKSIHYKFDMDEFSELDFLLNKEFADVFDDILIKKKYLILDGSAETKRQKEFIKFHKRINGIGSILINPIHVSDTIHGLFYVADNPSKNEWQEEDTTFTISLSNLIALVIESHANIESTLSLKKNLELRNILMTIATEYINLNLEKMEVNLDASLKKLATFVQADRAYIFKYNHAIETCTNTYEYCAEGISPQIQNLQNYPFSEMGEWLEMHLKGETIFIANIANLPEGNLKDTLEDQDIKSLVSVPMILRGACIGFIGFDAVKEFKNFNQEEISLLTLFGQILVNLYDKADSILEIESKTKQIAEINQTLMHQVEKQTERNVLLNQTLYNQDKLATIGEIASGIAHDLNTPLGAIKIGVESIQYTLQNLFGKLLKDCSPEELDFAYERATHKKMELFIGGIQIQKEQMEFLEFLTNEYDIEELSRKNLAGLFVQARINPTDKEIVDKVLSARNPESFLAVIQQLQTIKTFISTILISTERSTEVVKNLRNFIKIDANQQRSTVDLKKNLSTVIDIFNYQIKNKINLHVNLMDNLCIEGYDVKLFQLWSNLIKNAVEAIEDLGDIWIYSKVTENTIEISIENNGEMISEETMKLMFNKLFSTKLKSNGTGLGLSIVKNVLDEHSAKIEVNSSTERTVFRTIFPKNSSY